MITHAYLLKTGGRFVVSAPHLLPKAELRTVEREVCAASSTDCSTPPKEKEAPDALVD